MPFGVKKNSATAAKKSESEGNILGLIIPVYIIVSIIAFALIGYFNLKGALENSSGQNAVKMEQAMSQGIEQGYVTAFGQVYEAVAGNCQEPTLINFGEVSVNVIDVACLQATAPEATKESAEQTSE